ncbi:hypothetical protein LY16_01866 [Xenorhabdus doucetiae]|uniref:Uncharacterized protein n=1 Tax=Xenorhabdus doucetiae TaxID=351671 RepID=A0ABY3NRL3_9GAMM|nr:hypothetical protein LY16_01866 [Xenorhabdus doucetiae]
MEKLMYSVLDKYGDIYCRDKDFPLVLRNYLKQGCVYLRYLPLVLIGLNLLFHFFFY